MPDNLGPVEVEFVIPEDFGKQADSAIKKMAGLTGAAVAMPKQVKAAITDQKEIIKGIENDIKSLEKTLKGVGTGTAKQEVIQEANAAKKALAEEKAALSDLERQFETSKESNRRLTYQFRDMTDQLAKMRIAGQQDTEAYRQLEAEAAKMSEQMQQTRQVVKNLSDDQRSVRGLAEGVTVLSGAFSAGMGAIGMFAGENENLVKIQTKVQSLMAITIGLQQLANTLDRESAFMTVTVANAKAKWIAVEKTLTAALWGSNAAAKALMITITGGLALAIPIIISLYDRWRGSQERALEAQRAALKANLEANVEAGKARIELDLMISKLQNFHGSKEQEKRIIEEVNKKYGDSFGKYETLAKWLDVLKKKTNDYVEIMFKQAQAQSYISDALKFDSRAKSLETTPVQDFVNSSDVMAATNTITGRVDESVVLKRAQDRKDQEIKVANAWKEASLARAKRAQAELEYSKIKTGLNTPAETEGATTEAKTYEQRIQEVKKFYELYNLAIEQGQQAAAEAFKKQLPDNAPTFADYIKNEFKNAGNDKVKLAVLLPESAEVQKGMKELLDKYKTYSEERAGIEEKYNDEIAMLTVLGLNEQAKLATDEKNKKLKELDDNQPLALLIEKYKDYDGQIKAVEEKYQKEIEELKKAGYAKEAQMADDARKKEIEAIEANKMKASTIWGSLFEDTGEVTRIELEKIIAVAKANMETLKETLTPDDIKAINAQIDKLQGKVDKITTKKTRGGNPFTDLADAVKRYNDEASKAEDKTQALKDALNAAAEMADSLFRTADDAVEILTDLGVISKDQAENTRKTLKDVQGLVEGGLTLAMGIASGNPVQIIEGTVQAISSLVKLFDFKSKKIAELQKNVTAEINVMERAYIKLQHAIDTAIGTEKYDKQREAIKANQDEIKKYYELVWSEKSKKDKKEDQQAIDEWLAKINELTIANDELQRSIQEDMLQTNNADFSNTIMDALISSTEQGIDAVNALNNAFDDFIKDAIANAFKLKFIQPFVDDLLSAAYELMNDADGLTPADKETLQQMYKPWSEQLADAWAQIADAFGFAQDVTNAASDTTGGFAKMDQSTGNQLLGQFTALRMSAAGVFDILQAEMQSRDTMRNSLIAIEVNTRSAADTLRTMDGKLTEIVTDGVKLR